MKYKSPNISSMNGGGATPRGGFWQVDWVAGESFIAVEQAVLFIQVAFQFDTTLPISVNNESE